MNFGDLEVKWLGHAGFLIAPSGVPTAVGKNSTPLAYTQGAREPLRGPDKSSKEIATRGKVIYIDPFKIKDGLPKADLILITHGHYDHCSVEDLNKIVKEGTRILMAADSQSKIARFETPVRMEVVHPNEDYDFGSVKISTFPAYNVGKHFHSPDEDLVGYLIKIGDVLIYHAGDTDVIPEMQKLTGYNQQGKTFVALLPVGGRFTMSAEEAFEAAKMIKPTVAIPMHWGSIIGNKEDAEEFKNLCEDEGIECKILEKE